MRSLIAYPISPEARGAALFSADDRLPSEKTNRVRILVVEDDYLAATEIESVLAEAGFEVVGVASTAEEAVRVAKVESPTLAIMDIRLASRRDGVDAALEIFHETGVRCIFASAHHDRLTRERARPAAPLGWLAKPYASHSLLVMVRHALTEL